MTGFPFLRGFLRTLVGLRDSSRGYVIQQQRAVEARIRELEVKMYAQNELLRLEAWHLNAPVRAAALRLSSLLQPTGRATSSRSTRTARG